MVYNGQQIKMKKLLISATLIIGMIAGAMVLSSFTQQNKEETVLEMTSSPVWKGTAYRNGAYGKNEYIFNDSGNKRITVYPSDNSCGSYYAIVDGDRDEVHYTVKNNPSYDSNLRDSERTAHYSHYITIDGRDYFFRM